MRRREGFAAVSQRQAPGHSLGVPVRMVGFDVCREGGANARRLYKAVKLLKADATVDGGFAAARPAHNEFAGLVVVTYLNHRVTVRVPPVNGHFSGFRLKYLQQPCGDTKPSNRSQYCSQNILHLAHCGSPGGIPRDRLWYSASVFVIGLLRGWQSQRFRPIPYCAAVRMIVGDY